MRNNSEVLSDFSHLKDLRLPELRHQWSLAWGLPPHPKIGRAMLIKSLQYKMRQQQNNKPDQNTLERLKKLVATYKRNPRCFDEHITALKPGTRLVKIWKEQRHSVMVLPNGFEYKGHIYSSISEVAFAITGSRWNGWVFFGIKRHRRNTGAADDSAN